MSNPTKAYSSGTMGDNIWVWDPTLNDGAGAWAVYFHSAFVNGYVAEADSAMGPAAPLATTPVAPGSTILFFRGTQSTSASTMTLAGGVEPLAGKVQHTGIANGKYKFICYPWPIAFNVNKVADCQTNPAKGYGSGTMGDNVWLWDATLNGGAGAWAVYFYSAFVNGYVAETDSALGPGAPLANVEIPAGEGFLFFRGTLGTSDETITFKGPNYVEPVK